MTKHKRSLAAVVKEEREASQCMLCVIPERLEVEAERRNGAEIRHIVQWLVKDCGYPEEEVLKQRTSRMTKHFLFHMEKLDE